MNRKNKILVGCLALLLALSVGYALFSETITINGTATAKGSFDNEITCYTKNYPYSMVGAEGSLSFNEFFESVFNIGGYENANCTVSGNKVTYSVDLLYPGSSHIIMTEIKNTGTIDVIYQADDIGAVPVLENKKETLILKNKKTDEIYSTITNPSVDDKKNYGRYDYITSLGLKKSDGTLIIDNDSLNAHQSIYKDASGTLYLRVKPGESLIIGSGATWDESAVQTDYYSVTSLEAQFNALQLTSDYTLVSDGSLCLFGC